MQILAIIIPCYNEQEVLPETYKRLTKKIESLILTNKISAQSKVLFIDDGSTDNTWNIITSLHSKNKIVMGIKLSTNVGMQNALYSGLMTARHFADMIISMDSDLQDDINAIDTMINEYNNGAQIVYGVRTKRKTDSFFKCTTAHLFYKCMRTKIIYDHSDFRLMSKKAVNCLSEYTEVNLFLRGIVPLIGFKTAVVEYERNKRFAGKSKYPLHKMISFAFDGITSFSIKPITFITKMGLFSLTISVGIIIYSIVRKMTGHTVEGWTSLMASIWFIGSIIIISIGIIGIYIGKIYMQTKQRPRYFVEKSILSDSEINKEEALDE